MSTMFLEIVLDRPTRAYLAGEILSGKVVVLCSSKQECIGIKLKIQGFAKVQWQESNEFTPRKKVEWYLQHKEYLIGSGNEFSSKSFMAEMGRTEYPFNLPLPVDLPPSFVGDFGRTEYRIEVMVKRIYSLDKSTDILFTVKPRVDLTDDYTALMPAELKTVGKLWRVSGDLELDVKIPKSGFVAGETLSVVAEINNMSSKNVECVNFYLVQERKYTVKNKTKIETTVVASAARNGAEAHQRQMIRAPLFKIPEIFPSGMGLCKVIDVQYKFRVEAVIPGLKASVKGEIPLIIGTIPVGGNSSELGLTENSAEKDSTATNNVNGRADFAPTAPPAADFQEMPPPSYEYAMSYGQNNFTEVVGAAALPWSKLG